jgi:hypothetical protein
MIRFYKNTELPDFRKAGYYNNMYFAIHLLSANHPDPICVFAEGSIIDISVFEHIITDNNGNELSRVALDETMFSIIAGNYLCNWVGLGSPLNSGFGQFSFTNGVYTWLSEPFLISDGTDILVNEGSFDSSFSKSFDS